MGDPATLSRSWRWLRSRILGVLSTPPTYFQEGGGFSPSRVHLVWHTRTQCAVYGPPKFGALSQTGEG